MIFPSKEFLKTFKETNGALSVSESIAIMNIASMVKPGLFAEYGTYMGKSAMSAMYSLPDGVFYLYEPDFVIKINQIEVAETLLSVESKVKTVNLMREYSTTAIPKFSNYSYVFIDSGIHDDLVMEEVKLIEDRVINGGIICFHDYKNQFTAVERAYNYLLSTGKYEEIKIDWQPIFDYVKDHDLEDGNNSWHQYPELPHPPNFVGALKRK